MVQARTSNYLSIPVIHRDCVEGYQLRVRSFAGQPTISASRVGVSSDIYPSITKGLPTLGSDFISFELVTAGLTPSQTSGFIHVEIQHPGLFSVSGGLFPFSYSIDATEFSTQSGCSPDRTSIDEPFVIRRSASEAVSTDYFAYAGIFENALDDDYISIDLDEGERITVSVVSRTGTIIDFDGLAASADLSFMSADKLPACYEFSDDYSGAYPYGSSFPNAASCQNTSDPDLRRDCCLSSAAERGFLAEADSILPGEGVSRFRPNMNYLTFTAYAAGTYLIRARPYREEVYPYRIAQVGANQPFRDKQTNAPLGPMPAPYQINVAVHPTHQDLRPPYPVFNAPPPPIPPGPPIPPPDPPKMPPPVVLPILPLANPIRLVGVATADNIEPFNEGAPLIIEPPDETADGDLLIAAVFHSAVTPMDIIAPPGWTQLVPPGLVPLSNPAVLGQLEMFYKVASDEPTSYSFTRGDPFFVSCMHMMVYRNVDPDDPFVDLGSIEAPAELPVSDFDFSTVRFRQGTILVGTLAFATNLGSGAGDGIIVDGLDKRVSTVFFDDKVLEGFDQVMLPLTGYSGNIHIVFPFDAHPLAHFLALRPIP